MADGASRGRLHVGTSGWSYRSWHGDFYPADLKRADELAYLSRRLGAAEINASFYRLQRASTYARWREQTPPDHVFALKGSRYVTHLKRLREPAPHLERLVASGIEELGPKLDVLLWQLPAALAFDREVLQTFVTQLTGGPTGRWRHAIEPRHNSFGSEEAVEVLTAAGVATVWSDGAGKWPAIERDTAGFRYVRLHGHTELYASRYSGRTLDAWAQRCREWMDRGQDVHVYFDNDMRGHAPHDAERLRAKVLGED